jgi:hypothetical protein
MADKSVDQKVYCSMTDSLLYLMPDIFLSVCMCAKFHVAPKVFHLRAIKKL